MRAHPTDYGFIDPLLFLKTNKSLYEDEFKPLTDSLNAYVTSTVGQDATSTVSVYFNDLNDGHWTGINETALYEPSSMLKVAVMVGYYKAAESDPGVLTDRLYYPGLNASGQYYIPSDHVEPGYYEAQDLIDDMIVYSDNTALKALMDADQQRYLSVAKDLELPLPPNGAAVDYMSPQAYSRIFRILYNSSYLTWDDSERALQLLASTTFTQGIVSGVPAGTVVSHKFGEFSDLFGPSDSLAVRELHDCGIIYYPDHPYFLCVMTRGADFPTLANTLSGVSRIVYAYVSGLK